MPPDYVGFTLQMAYVVSHQHDRSIWAFNARRFALILIPWAFAIASLSTFQDPLATVVIGSGESGVGSSHLADDRDTKPHDFLLILVSAATLRANQKAPRVRITVLGLAEALGLAQLPQPSGRTSRRLSTLRLLLLWGLLTAASPAVTQQFIVVKAFFLARLHTRATILAARIGFSETGLPSRSRGSSKSIDQDLRVATSSQV